MRAKEMLEFLTKDTQNYLVLKHMIDHNGITTMDAFIEYGVSRLASRIHDLRAMGIPIGSVTIAKNGKHFSLYYLEEKYGNV